MHPVNPLYREHQLALLNASLVGRDPVGGWHWLAMSHDPAYVSFSEFGWGILGALIGAGSTFTAVLLRK